MKEKIIFTNGLIDLAQPRLGTKVIFKTDDFKFFNFYKQYEKQINFTNHFVWFNDDKFSSLSSTRI